MKSKIEINLDYVKDLPYPWIAEIECEGLFPFGGLDTADLTKEEVVSQIIEYLQRALSGWNGNPTLRQLHPKQKNA